MKKYLIYPLATALFVIPAFVFAISDVSNVSSIENYTEEQLVSLISKLQQRLEELRKNKVTCNVGDIALSIGDGEDEDSKVYVKSLQGFLKEKGHFTFHTTTGYFGKITQASLIQFQKTNGL